MSTPGKEKQTNSDMGKRRLCSKGLQQDTERGQGHSGWGHDITVRSTTRHYKVRKAVRAGAERNFSFTGSSKQGQKELEVSRQLPLEPRAWAKTH